jgi:hypothetical protein
MVTVLAAVLTGATLVALLLTVLPVHGVSRLSLSGFLPVIIVLLFAAAFSWLASLRSSPAARRLVVSPQGLSFEAIPARNDIRLRWDDQKLWLRVYDRRGLPKVHRDGTPRNPFAAEPKPGAFTPIPEEAFNLILQEASSRGLAVTQREVAGGRTPGTYKVTLIRTPSG